MLLLVRLQEEKNSPSDTLLGITDHPLDICTVLGYKGTPRDSNQVAEKLKQIKGVESVVLVFDGKKGGSPETHVSTDGFFQLVALGEGISADDYIEGQAKLASVDERVQVVTADRDLRRKVLSVKPAVKNVVNPLTFWKRYLPRLCGYKKPKQVAAL